MKKEDTNATFHFSSRLTRQLGGIAAHPLTVVEAPSGFGKTTAVREYLATHGKKLGTPRWYTCLGESPPRAWAGICALFRGLDANAENRQGQCLADELLALGPPTHENLPDVAALLQQCQPDTKYCLIIDNYQLFEHNVPRKLLLALAACHNENLRFVVITQSLPPESETTHQSHHSLETHDFFFDVADVASHCRMHGLDVPIEKIERIHNASGGWIAAIRLQLKSYVETGVLMDAQGIGKLVEVAVWNRLHAPEQEYLLILALLDGFTAQQATMLGGETAMSKTLQQLLSMDFFIRHVVDTKMYHMHSTLRDYLLLRLEVQPKDVTEAMCAKAAAACLTEGDYYQAARLYEKTGNYNAILAMPFTDQYFFNHQEDDIVSFFVRVFAMCPRQILLAHPLTVLVVGIQFYKKGMRALYAQITHWMQEYLANPPDMPPKQLYTIKGEFEMLLSVSKFNDIDRMAEHHRKAYAYLKQVSDPPRSGIYAGDQPWAVGVPSVISVYWNKVGGLQAALDAMDACLPLYSQLAGGHGMGGEFVMHAEACLMRGDDEEAETLCYKALYTSKNAGQTSNCLCAEQILARIGLLRGDSRAYHTARSHIVNEMEQARQTALTRLGEMCLAKLDMTLEKKDILPEWLCSVRSIQKTLYSVSQPHAVMLHCQMLLLEERYHELYTLSHSALPAACAMNYILLQTYHHIFLTRSALNEGQHTEAVEHLRKALALTLSDRVYLPFAEHGDVLLPLLESVRDDFDREQIQECTAFCRRWAAGFLALKRAVLDAAELLSPREADVARLAQERMSVEEIATTLYVSQNTVKTHLQNVYRKLGIKNKSGLKNIEW